MEHDGQNGTPAQSNENMPTQASLHSRKDAWLDEALDWGNGICLIVATLCAEQLLSAALGLEILDKSLQYWLLAGLLVPVLLMFISGKHLRKRRIESERLMIFQELTKLKNLLKPALEETAQLPGKVAQIQQSQDEILAKIEQLLRQRNDYQEARSNEQGQEDSND